MATRRGLRPSSGPAQPGRGAAAPRTFESHILYDTLSVDPTDPATIFDGAPYKSARAARRFGRSTKVLVGLATALVLALVASLFVAGPTGIAIDPASVGALVLQWLPLLRMPHVWSATQSAIVLDYRVPRALTAALAGGALAASGATFQGIFRNPLADPAVVGVSSGAALGATAAMLLPIDTAYFGFSLITLSAFAGAVIAVALVYSLARAGGRLPVATLLLAGFAVSAMLNAVTTLIMSLSSGGRLEGMFFWMLGGLDQSTPDQLLVAALLIGAGMLPVLALSRNLNALALGDESAMYLGLNPVKTRLALTAGAALIAATAVALCGIIGFVGLVVPHMVRLLFGPDNRLLLPAATLGGAVFLTTVDTAARALAPVQISIGVITALLGAPLFLVLLRRRGVYAF